MNNIKIKRVFNQLKISIYHVYTQETRVLWAPTELFPEVSLDNVEVL